MNEEKEKVVASLIEEGDKHQKNGDFSSAMKSYSATLELDPYDALAYHSRGWARVYQGDREGAALDWSKAIELVSTENDSI